MQTIAWGWRHEKRPQSYWARKLGTTTDGSAISEIVRLVNRKTGYDSPRRAGPYVVLDISGFSLPRVVPDDQAAHRPAARAAGAASSAPAALLPLPRASTRPATSRSAAATRTSATASRGSASSSRGTSRRSTRARRTSSGCSGAAPTGRSGPTRPTRCRTSACEAARGSGRQSWARRLLRVRRPDGLAEPRRPTTAASSAGTPSDPTASSEPSPSEPDVRHRPDAQPRHSPCSPGSPSVDPVEEEVTTGSGWTAVVDEERSLVTLSGARDVTVSGDKRFRVDSVLLDEGWAVVVLRDTLQQRPSRATRRRPGDRSDHRPRRELRPADGQRWHLGPARRAAGPRHAGTRRRLLPRRAQTSARAGPTRAERSSTARPSGTASPTRASLPAEVALMAFDDHRPSCRTLGTLADGDLLPLPGVEPCKGWEAVVTESGPVWSEIPRPNVLDESHVYAGARPRRRLGRRPRPGHLGQPDLVRRRDVLRPRPAVARRAGPAAALDRRRRVRGGLRDARAAARRSSTDPGAGATGSPSRRTPSRATSRCRLLCGEPLASGGVTFTGFPVAALDFYDDLEMDNTKSFWEKHKAVYDEGVKAPMVALLAGLAPEFAPDGQGGKIFRPYRDVRFAKDKTPYKTHQGALRAGRPRDRLLRRAVGARGPGRRRLLRREHRAARRRSATRSPTTRAARSCAGS